MKPSVFIAAIITPSGIGWLVGSFPAFEYSFALRTAELVNAYLYDGWIIYCEYGNSEWCHDARTSLSHHRISTNRHLSPTHF